MAIDTGMSKEEILGHIQRLRSDRKKKARLLAAAIEARKERDENLPAFDEMQKASEQAQLAADKLNNQRDADSTWQDLNASVKDASDDLKIVDSSLSEMLVQWQLQTGNRQVHADPNESRAVDHEIKTVAKIGKKVPANVSLFDKPGGEDDKQD